MLLASGFDLIIKMSYQNIIISDFHLFILCESALKTHVTWNIRLMFLQGSLKIMGKHSSSNVNRIFIQSFLVFNNVLNMFVQNLKMYTYFVECFLTS